MRPFAARESVTGPTDETPCVQAGLSAVAVVTTTTAMREPSRTSRSSLATQSLVTAADPYRRKTPPSP